MKVYRTEVDVNDEWCLLDLTGPIVKVATRRDDVVEIWYQHDDDVGPWQRRFRVYGTGEFVPGNAVHVDSVITPRGLVWHLFEGCPHDPGTGHCGRIICLFCAPLGAPRPAGNGRDMLCANEPDSAPSSRAESGP